MKVSFITTVYNEEKTISKLLDSLFKQSKLPDEVIIVDGGSSDNTVAKLKTQNSKLKTPIRFKIIIRKGNRAVGRNEAIRNATGDIIVCSDAGCILDKNWVKNITDQFKYSKVDVVAGYYKGLSNSIFQRCLVPYVLVMPDKINEQDFLPASRSMAFKKSIWKKVGGFPEEFSHNEDYVFAQRLKSIKANIVFNKAAVAYWLPRKNIKEAFTMFFRFAFGDAESKILRPKVLLIFARYLFGLYLLLLLTIMRAPTLLYGLILGLLIYMGWLIKKNYKYVQKVQAFLFLPIFQLVSDMAVIIGTTCGFLKQIRTQTFLRIIKNNKGASIIVGIYVSLILAVIDWGIPNKDHPFSYHMDEWHQAQAVRTVFTQGSPNVPGSANGSMFHFFLVGIYLLPFIVFGVVNPFAIESFVSSLDIQYRLFQILRLNTLLFGIGSIILIAYIGKKYFKLHPFLVSFLFSINPIWLTLSNYFKYDIALTFWIILSLLLLLRYSISPSLLNFSLASFISGLAFSTKLSAIPLLPIVFVSYILFNPKRRENIHHLVMGSLVFFFTFLAFGIPDLLLSKGDIREYLYSNLVATPKEASNLLLGMNYLVYLLTEDFPSSFGRPIFYTFVLAIVLVFYLFFSQKESLSLRSMFKNKKLILIYASLILFSLSLIPLGFDARGNRLLVLLPFIVIITSAFVTNIFRNLQGFKKNIFLFIFFLSLLFQIFETFVWISVKFKTDPRSASSTWIERNVPKGRLIGIENIPIYQSLPDVVLKEYYNKQYNQNAYTRYNYRVIDYQSDVLPNIIIVTNDEVVDKYLKKSSKKLLLKRLKKEKYKRIARFQPDYSYFKFIGNELIFFYSQLPALPNTVSVFFKHYNL